MGSLAFLSLLDWRACEHALPAVHGAVVTILHRDKGGTYPAYSMVTPAPSWSMLITSESEIFASPA